MKIHSGTPPGFPSKERERSSRLRSTAAKQLSFVTGLPQLVEFLDENPALSAPFLETKLVAVSRKRREWVIGNVRDSSLKAGFCIDSEW